ncbi:MAG: glycosyltransferase family 4 protein [Bacteroidales bacterium]|nr:glycosyltransferase family 4 protein [Bacteroidales bacterium]
MNILLLNHYAGSPKLGMEYRPYYLAKEWVNLGHAVTIVAATHSHIRQKNRIQDATIEREEIDGIQYIWIKTPQYSGNGIGRIKNMFAYVKTLFFNALQLSNELKPDVVIASSTYPSDNYVARKIAKKSNAKFLYEVHDLWPLSPMELGGMSKYHPFIILMQHSEDFAYKHCDAVISMLPVTKDHMKSRGLNLKKWYYIPNGVKLSEWETPLSLNQGTIKSITEFKQGFKNTIAYAGTFGVANALDSFVLSAKSKTDTAFFLIGKGPEKDHLLSLIKKEQLQNVFILEAVQKEEIPALLNEFDFLYIGLQKQALFRFGISPNKLIDYMMASKPIIQAIEAGNNVVKEANCGVDIEPENPKAIVESIEFLEKMQAEDLKQLGVNGHKFVLQNHDYRILAKKFISVLESL